jgi:hypothetical protein
MAVRPRVDNCKPIRLFLRPAIADVDPNVVAGRHLPAKLTIEGVVILDARKNRHGARLVSGQHVVQPDLLLIIGVQARGVAARPKWASVPRMA